MNRIYRDGINIDENSIKKFYSKRAKEKVEVDIDAPVVLCGDKDKSKIDEWTRFEVESRLHLLELNKNNVVLELGCGTGRISKFITNKVHKYIGIDYVEEFIDIAKKRNDIYFDKDTHFIHCDFNSIVNNKDLIPFNDKINRFIISGGVFMYINDKEIQEGIQNLVKLLDEKCIIYISEPIGVEERLTLNKFYSENLDSEYSAIYRTVREYDSIFECFYRYGFKLKISEEFFINDIKEQKETKQWIFVLER